MARFTGWKKRYSYLDDYRKGMDGKYVYYGKHYIFCAGADALRTYKWLLGLADLLVIGLFIVSGLMDAGAIWSTWYTVVPYALEAVCVFIFAWKTISMLLEKVPLKAYIYKKTVPWFRPVCLILAVIALISLCGALICMLVKSAYVKTAGCIIYMVLQLVLAAGCAVFAGVLKKYNWEPDPSEEPEE